MKYTLGKIAAVCGGRLVGPQECPDMEIGSVFTDSRNFPSEAGALFVAIPGRNHDGHAYINELYARGVRAFLIEKDVNTEKYTEAGFIRVENSVAALQALAADYRSGFKGIVVGITGSNGKTVVKEWIADLVPPEVKLFRNPKSYNSQIGVPLSILMMEGGEQVAVIEAGISEPGEMERLEKIIRPDIGIITTIGDAHQENFDSLEQKLAQKLILFRGSRTVIYNSDYPQVAVAVKNLFPKARLEDAAGQAEAYAAFADRASQQNAATAVTLCDVLGYDHKATLARMAGLHPVAMRLELKEGINNSLIINDSYNSDINSLAIALDYLRGVAGGKPQTLIISDILQSGYPEAELYDKVAQLVNRSQIDRIVGIGDRIKLYGHLFGARSEFFASSDAYLRNVRRKDVAGRAILLKGNRRSQFERISHALEQKSHTTVMEVDLDAMIHNLNAHRAMLAPATKVMAMVKASGYGHGSYEVASMLQHQGVDYLAVAFADEGVALRESGITMPIVVLNADSDSFELMIANSLEPEIYSFQSLAGFAAALKRYGERSYPVHLKLDTGMHRLGFVKSDVGLLCEELDRNKNVIRVSSIFSHLASSDEPAHDEFTRAQIELFRESSGRIIESLGYRPLRHIANSSAIARFPEAQFDMVRLGIGLYGIGHVPGASLREVTTMSTRIVQVKELTAGETVGYGRGGRLEAPARIATLPVGYADGLNRRLGNGNWSVVVNGRQAPTVGRICMDTCMVDVTGTDAAEGARVVIFGGGPGNGNGIADMACVLDTIAYEVMTSVSARVKRIYIKE